MQQGSPGLHLFTLFRTPVFAHWTFALLLLLLSMPDFDRGLDVGFLTVLSVVLSLLVHEFGHVYAARTNGFRSFVVLGGMGAYTAPSGESRGWRGVWLSAAGPLFGFGLWALLWFGLMPAALREEGLYLDWRAVLWPSGAVAALVPTEQLTGGHHLWAMLCTWNLWWGLFNLVPIHPLDGGHIVSHVLRLRMRALEAERLSAISSIAVAAAVVYLLWTLLGRIPTFTLIIVGFLVLSNVQRLQALKGGRL